MSRKLSRNVDKALPLPDGGAIVLIDMLGDKSATWEDDNRNVYRVDAEGNVIWQIGTTAAPDERVPYTNVYFDDQGGLRAYSWRGVDYPVNIVSGEIGKGELVK
jgi:hypothetical protein